MSIPSRRHAPMAGAAIAIAILAAAGTATAHHGWGAYDADRPITVSGPIRAVAFEQPHVSVRVEAADKTWTVVLAPISRMNSRGAGEDVVQVGRTITAFGYPHREIADEIRAERITIDGRTIEMR